MEAGASLRIGRPVQWSVTAEHRLETGLALILLRIMGELTVLAALRNHKTVILNLVNVSREA